MLCDCAAGADLTDDSDWYYCEEKKKWLERGKEDEADAVTVL